jgi:hypothetical protein
LELAEPIINAKARMTLLKDKKSAKGLLYKDKGEESKQHVSRQDERGNN